MPQRKWSPPSSAESLIGCATPEAWLQAALQQQDILLIDHANCEKKAASTALSLLYRYVERPELLQKLSRLAREELRHFEQVLAIMQARSIDYVQLSPSRYAGALHELVRPQEPQRLLDTLLIGAVIEARSYERFKSLAPLLDSELQKFYRSLLQSEERHFQEYLQLAERYFDEDFSPRIALIAEREAELISSEDAKFRFHSGAPITE
ncbi:MAG: tRNA-(ms[2]io[6]A)-hydroxylase [Pseudomonadales bacterium]